jgi:hypothetical protein
LQIYIVDLILASIGLLDKLHETSIGDFEPSFLLVNALNMIPLDLLLLYDFFYKAYRDFTGVNEHLCWL